MGKMERWYEGEASPATEPGWHLGGPSLHHGPRGRNQRRRAIAVGRPRTSRSDHQSETKLMRRRRFLTLLFSQAGCLRTRKPALARAAQYLWSQQASDGGWHSNTYGLLRSGQSLTPFVLDALLQIPGKVYALPATKV